MYNSFAKDFDRTRTAIWPCVKNFLHNHIPRYAFVIDIGAGNGKYVKYLENSHLHTHAHAHITATDISFPLLEIIKEKSTSHNVNLFQANGLHLPIKDSMFDTAISIAVVHHIPTHDQRINFIKEALRIIKSKTGQLFITVWALEQPIKSSWIPLSLTTANSHDYNIPWNHTYSRFYHLFSESEVKQIFEDLLSENHIKEYHIFFEKNNWCIRCIKS